MPEVSQIEKTELSNPVAVSDNVPRRWSRLDLAAAWPTWLSTSSSWDLATYGLLSIVAVLIVLTFTQYGITWDEPIQNMYGAQIAAAVARTLRSPTQHDAWHQLVPLWRPVRHARCSF
jgi:hypothetical protein